MDMDRLRRIYMASDELEAALSQIRCAMDCLRDALEGKTANALFATLESIEAEIQTLIAKIKALN